MEQSINQRFKLLRQHLGLNQVDLGKALGVMQATISAIEISRQVVTPQTMDLLHKKFKVNKYWLIEGKGEMFEAKEIPKPASKAAEWKDEAFFLVKEENSILKDQIKRLETQINMIYAMANQLTGGKLNVNFKKAPGKAGTTYNLVGVQSGAQLARA